MMPVRDFRPPIPAALDSRDGNDVYFQWRHFGAGSAEDRP